MNAFVTGAGGCVGRQLVGRLLDLGWEAACLLLPGEADNFAFKGHPRVRAILGDVNSLPDGAVPRGAAVFHLAAQVHTVPRSAAQRQRFFEVNRDGTARVAQVARDGGASAFVFISTIAVYGKRLDSERCGEETPAEPLTPYGQSKLEGEQKVREILAGAAPFVVVRPCVVYGPGDRGNFARMIDRVRKGSFPLVAGGRALKNTLYVKNLAAVLAFLGEHTPEFAAATFNVADPSARPMREIAQCVADALGIPLRLRKVPLWPLRIAAGIGDCGSAILRRELPLTSRKLRVLTSDSVVDVSRMTKALEGRLKLLSLEEGLRDYLTPSRGVGAVSAGAS